MPEYTPVPAGGPDGALAWYNQSLAKVLGLSPGDPTLGVDQLSELATPVQRRALGRLIGNRFRRSIDDETGAVIIDQVGDPLVLIGPDEEADPMLAGIATSYLQAVNTAVGAIDTGQCVPGACPGQVAGLVDQIKATVEILAAEAPRRRSTLPMYIHLDELTNPSCGLFRKLNNLLTSKAASSVRSVERERALSSVRVAQHALTSFELAMREIVSDEDEATMSEVADIVRSCGAHIPAHVQNVRQRLRQAGIGDCEVQGLQLDLDRCIPLGGEDFQTISFDQALHALETEPRRWETLVAGGQEGFAAVASSATTLLAIVDCVQSDEVLKDLGILPSGEGSEPRDPNAAELCYRIDRLVAYAQMVLGRIVRESPPAAAPASRRRKPAPPPAPPKAPPPADTAPLT